MGEGSHVSHAVRRFESRVTISIVTNVIDPVTAHGLATARQEQVIECDSEVIIM